jgi:DHA1 family bicyclomycin/chloramphenicol resistance-like MFS transporter
MVIARSLVVDLASGPRLVKALNLVQGIAGVAPIVGPLLGALILQLSHWRMSSGCWPCGARSCWSPSR